MFSNFLKELVSRSQTGSFALPNRLFCIAKQALLQGKTIAFCSMLSIK